MRGILIDPETRLLKEIETDGSLQELRRLIDCNLVDVAHLPAMGQDDLYVDDEGLMASGRRVFEIHDPEIEGGSLPLVGRAVLIGFNPDTGESADALMHIEELRGFVRWTDLVVT